MSSIQLLGLEPITQYLSHHNHDYHDMPVGNLIGITNMAHVDANAALAELDAQRTQLLKIAEVDVTAFEAFRIATYTDGEAVVTGDFKNTKRVVNFFAMVQQAQAAYQSAGLQQNMVITAQIGELSLKVTAEGVAVEAAQAQLAEYLGDVIVNGFSA